MYHTVEATKPKRVCQLSACGCSRSINPLNVEEECWIPGIHILLPIDVFLPTDTPSPEILQIAPGLVLYYETDRPSWLLEREPDGALQLGLFGQATITSELTKYARLYTLLGIWITLNEIGGGVHDITQEVDSWKVKNDGRIGRKS